MDAYLEAIARGTIPGASGMCSYGTVTTTGAASGVVYPTAPFSFPPPAGVQMSLVSTSAQDSATGTGLRTIALHYLDNNLLSRVEEVTLNGLTPVLTVATNIRFIQCMHVITAGSGKAAAGNITASNGGVGYSVILSTQVRCSSSVRMVPANKQLVVTGLIAGASSGSAAAQVRIRLASTFLLGYDTLNQGIFVPQLTFACQDSTISQTIDNPAYVFPAGAAVGMTYITDKAATITGSWSGYLEKAI